MIEPNEGLGAQIRLRSEAEQRRWAQYAKSGNIRDLDGNMMDPMWDAMFEAMHSAGVTNVGDDSVGAKRGMFSPSTTPHVQQLGMESNQIGTAGQQGTQAVLNGIFGATGRRKQGDGYAAG